MIDLHIHTNFSDGTDTFIEVLKKAESLGLDYIAITDHETCGVYNELDKIDIKQYFTGKIIRGVELKTELLDIPIEFLGYGVSPKIINEEVRKMYLSPDERNLKEGEALYEICKELGMKLDDDIMDKFDKEKYPYFSTYIHECITKYPENKKFFISDEAWNDAMSAFYRLELSNPESNFCIKGAVTFPTPEELIALIRKAGGLVFVPHIFNYKDNWKKIFDYINENFDIDGYECYYSKFTQEQTEFMLDYCKKNNLYISGGSDYHGKNKPKIELGIGMGDLKIPTEIINDWVNKVTKE